MPRRRPGPPLARPEQREGPRRPAIGVVLSGGGARGFAHIGFLRVLERYGIEVEAVAGTSMGAILGALYAHGYRADDLHEIASSVSWRDVIDLSLIGGMMKGDKLHALLETYLPSTFQELAKPLAVTCTDIEAAEQLVFTEGALIVALRASACFPGAFEPVEYAGRTLADGGILNNLPVDALALMRCELTLASDVSPPRRAVYVGEADEPASWWERMVATVTLERRAPLAAVTFRATDIMMRLLTDVQYVHHPTDLRVQHEMPAIRLESFWALDEIVAEGEMQAEAALRTRPDLVARLRERSVSPPARRAVPRVAGGAKVTPTDGGQANGAPNGGGDEATADGASARTLWSHLRRG